MKVLSKFKTLNNIGKWAAKRAKLTVDKKEEKTHLKTLDNAMRSRKTSNKEYLKRKLKKLQNIGKSLQKAQPCLLTALAEQEKCILNEGKTPNATKIFDNVCSSNSIQDVIQNWNPNPEIHYDIYPDDPDYEKKKKQQDEAFRWYSTISGCGQTIENSLIDASTLKDERSRKKYGTTNDSKENKYSGEYEAEQVISIGGKKRKRKTRRRKRKTRRRKRKTRRRIKGGNLNKHIENYVNELNKRKPDKKELEKHKKLYLESYAKHMGVPLKVGIFRNINKDILESFENRVKNEKQSRFETSQRQQQEIIERNLRRREVEDARQKLVSKKLGNEKEQQQYQDTLNIRALQGQYLGATGSAVIPEGEMPETSASRYIKRKEASRKRGQSKLRGGKYKTKKNKRKHKKRKSRRKKRKLKRRKSFKKK